MAAWVLADTSALIALFMQGDQWHQSARPVVEDLLRTHRRLLTTSDIFDETVTAIRRWAGHEAAFAAGESLRASALVRMVGIDDEIREAAWRIFRKYRDIPFSFTDCTSIAVMRKFRLTDIFTFDGDFATAGLTCLP
ncbi:MAG: type II toxin-antitoxin system VapC family toxin [Planctomycetes bacterium]|nr:type II toxin-antitoxin system VapC family toxin [Planctomycetota bacterium]